jgi:hypothetical protein
LSSSWRASPFEHTWEASGKREQRGKRKVGTDLIRYADSAGRIADKTNRYKARHFENFERKGDRLLEGSLA